jgi:hypothetical protein
MGQANQSNHIFENHSPLGRRISLGRSFGHPEDEALWKSTKRCIRFL